MVTSTRIGDAARVTGLPAETIRYYERAGVLPRVPRGPNGYRSYAPEHLETLRLAKSLRDLGLAPVAMAGLLTLFHDGTCADMQGALSATIGDALARLENQRLQQERTERHLRDLLAAVRSVSADGRPSGGPQPCSCVAIVESEEPAGSGSQTGAAR